LNFHDGKSTRRLAMTKKIRQHIRGWLLQPIFWLLALFLLAFVLRLYRLDTVPPGIHFDEIINGEIAVNAREEGLKIFYLAGWGREGLYHAFLAVSMTFPLPIAWQMRLPSALLSMVGLLLTYGWVSKNFGKWAAITAVAGLGISFWSLSLSRASLRAVTVLPVAACVIWLMLSITTDKVGRGNDSEYPRRSYLYVTKIVLLAIFMGALFYTYRAARVLLVIYVAYFIYLTIWHRPVRRGLIAAFLGSLIVALPLFLFLLNNPGAEPRIGQVDRPWQELLNGDLRPMMDSAFSTFGMFGLKGDLANHYNLSGRPVFEPLGFFLLIAGVIIALFRWRRSPYALILVWLGIGLLPGIVTEPAPHFIHTIMVMPVIFVFPGIAVAKSSEVLGERFGNGAKYGLGIALALWIVTNTLWTYRDYFDVWPQNAEVRNFYQSNLAELARYLDDSVSLMPTSICTEFLNEQDPFWRSGRQSMPFLINRSDQDLRWLDCRFAHVLPQSGPTALYLFPDKTGFAEWLPPNWSSITDELDLPTEGGFRGALVDTDQALEQLIEGIESPTGDAPPVNIGGIMEFLGYAVSSNITNPGESFDLYTYWRVQKPPPPEMAIFVHLTDNDDTMIAQGDALSLLSDTLQPGDIVVQSHMITIPEEADSGQYLLSTGVYSRIGTFPPLQIISKVDGSLQGERIWLTLVNVIEP
jgi:hypothetical protein